MRQESLLLWLPVVLYTVACSTGVLSQRVEYAKGRTNIVTEYVEFGEGDARTSAFVAHNILYSIVKPVILVVPDWGGKERYEIDEAIRLADQGYVGIAVDLYGSWNLTSEDWHYKFLFQYPTLNRTDFLRRLSTVLDKARLLDNTYIDQSKVAAIGFGYGGMTVLDLARTGKSLSGVVSFYANLSSLEAFGKSVNVFPKILILTGYEDYDVNTTMVSKFEEEMKWRDCDWTLVSYGNTKSRFTIPDYKESRGEYSRVSHKRSLVAMRAFFREIFHEDDSSEGVSGANVKPNSGGEYEGQKLYKSSNAIPLLDRLIV